MTFDKFCVEHGVTKHERRRLAFYLAMLRALRTVEILL